MSDDFAKSFFALLGLVPVVILKPNQKLYLLIFFVFLALKDYPVSVFALWYAVFTLLFLVIEIFRGVSSEAS
ncbi:MAG TPA: hypothetical protein V6C97_27180 [Oculatellaceae cyanobacterium]